MIRDNWTDTFCLHFEKISPFTKPEPGNGLDSSVWRYLNVSSSDRKDHTQKDNGDRYCGGRVGGDPDGITFGGSATKQRRRPAADADGESDGFAVTHRQSDRFAFPDGVPRTYREPESYALGNPDARSDAEGITR